jgi:hypothetical protein
MEDSIIQDLSRLEMNRNLLAQTKESLAVKKQQFEDDNKELFDVYEYQKSEVEGLTTTIKRKALELYKENPESKQIVPGAVTIKVFKNFVYSQDEAIGWAESNAPVFVKKSLDSKGFEKLCESMPLDFVELVEMPTAAIATDLSKGGK